MQFGTCLQPAYKQILVKETAVGFLAGDFWNHDIPYQKFQTLSFREEKRKPWPMNR